MRPAIWFFLPLILIAAMPGAAASQAAREELAISDIESLVATLENPEKRQELIAQLKLLIKAAKEGKPPAQAVKEAEKPEVAPILEKGSANIVKFAQFMAETIISLPGKAAALTQKIPDKLSAAWTYLYKKQNLLFLADLFIKLVITIGAGVVLLRLLRKYLVRYKRAVEAEGTRPGLIRRIALALFNIGIEASPYIALFIIGFIFSSLLGLPRTASASIYAALLLIMVWKILSALAQALISPGDRAGRLIPLPDELSAYAHRWSTRFINYGVFAYIPVALIKIAGAPAKYTAPMMAAYLFVFVAMASAISLQWKDKISGKLKINLAADEDRVKSLTIRAWNWIVSKLYIFFILYLVALFLLSTLGYSHITKKIVISTVETIVAILAAAAIWIFVSYLFEKLDFLRSRAEEKYPGLGNRVEVYLARVRSILEAIIAISAILLVFSIWGIDVYSNISSGVGAAILKMAISIGAVILLAYIAISVVQFFVQRAVMLKTGGKMEDLSQKGKTIIPLINKVIRYTIFSIAALIILQQLGIKIGPILAGAGIIGLAVGFGAQTLVKDIITGFFILVEDSISVGDVVVIKGTGGLVEAVNLRTIRMRDLSGRVHYIPNSSIEMVTNLTKDFSGYVIDVGVAYRENVDEVMEILKEIGAELQIDPNFAPDIVSPLEIFGVDDFADSAVIIKTRILTKPIRQWAVGRELKRRIKNTFDAKGIELPFPHRTLYFGEPKEGTPPPAHIKVEEFEQLLAEAATLNPKKEANEEKNGS